MRTAGGRIARNHYQTIAKPQVSGYCPGKAISQLRTAAFIYADHAQGTSVPAGNLHATRLHQAGEITRAKLPDMVWQSPGMAQGKPQADQIGYLHQHDTARAQQAPTALKRALGVVKVFQHIAHDDAVKRFARGILFDGCFRNIQPELLASVICDRGVDLNTFEPKPPTGQML